MDELKNAVASFRDNNAISFYEPKTTITNIKTTEEWGSTVESWIWTCLVSMEIW